MMEFWPPVVNELLKAVPIAVLILLAVMWSRTKDVKDFIASTVMPKLELIAHDVTEQKVWSRMHEDHDTERFEALNAHVQAIEHKVDRLLADCMNHTKNT